MVKAAKKAIYAVLCSSEVTDEELITLCTGAESLVDSCLCCEHFVVKFYHSFFFTVLVWTLKSTEDVLLK